MDMPVTYRLRLFILSLPVLSKVEIFSKKKGEYFSQNTAIIKKVCLVNQNWNTGL